LRHPHALVVGNGLDRNFGLDAGELDDHRAHLAFQLSMPPKRRLRRMNPK
jgi:hypothetical protein